MLEEREETYVYRDGRNVIGDVGCFIDILLVQFL